MPDTMTYVGQLVIESCPSCGIVHAIPASLQLKARRHGANVFCPLGHSWHYTRTVEQELASARDEAKFLGQRLRDERERSATLERSRAAVAGHLTRTKRRIAAGVCPCCRRSFQNLGRHMAGQHPEYASDDDAKGS